MRGRDSGRDAAGKNTEHKAEGEDDNVNDGETLEDMAVGYIHQEIYGHDSGERHPIVAKQRYCHSR